MSGYFRWGEMMGDRANVAVKASDKETLLYLYTHWGGDQLPHTVQAALKRQERWDDDSYLARIIFQEMLGGDLGTTGFGISTYRTDNEHSIVLVDVPRQVVGFCQEEQEPRTFKEWPFSEYVGLDEQTINEAYQCRD